MEKELEKSDRGPPQLPSKKGRGQDSPDFLMDGRSSAGKFLYKNISTHNIVKPCLLEEEIVANTFI